MTELHWASLVLGGLTLLGLAIRWRINSAVRELKDAYAVKTQLLQEELHEVYLRAVGDGGKQRRRNRYAKRGHTGHRRRLGCNQR